jgi:PilZ domain
MTLFADRRACVRFEVVGVLRGLLEVHEPVRVVDVSRTGALIETTTPIATGSIRPLDFIVDGKPVRVTLCARNLEQLPVGSYRIGIEFMSPSASLLTCIASLVTASGLTKGPPAAV